MAESKGTLAEVAARAGVSVPTVSKVLNGRADVSVATRARVHAAIDATGYVNRRAAQGDRVLELIIEGVDSPWAVEILRGAEGAAAARQAALIVTSTVHETFSIDRWLDAVRSRRSDGAVVVLPSDSADYSEVLERLRIPVVVVDPTGTENSDCATVGATNWAGGFEATNRLIELGHRRIGLIAGPHRLGCSLQREEGYAAALRRAGLPFVPELVQAAEFRMTGGHEAGGRLLDLPERPSAIFASSDQQAAGLYEAAREREIRVPSDLSVIGFDDTALSKHLSPALTTIHQPLADMAGEAVRLVLDLAADPKAHRSRRFELATYLVERSSAIPFAG